MIVLQYRNIPQLIPVRETREVTVETEVETILK